ncbi:hypothetical protein XELAEV_18011741mg [Xenopus laevis]|uniref:Uncharacterized protein n=1 Tax=Xenopus laevis TaxID=8355 RepID=A0A974DNZ0_XENLA|nr:hypothetical protein XELAEV_18011741mg [Xenopus laevis]
MSPDTHLSSTIPKYSSDDEEEWDLRAHLRSLPNKGTTNPEIEEAHKADIPEMRTDIQNIGTQIAELEQTEATTVDMVTQLRNMGQKQTSQLQDLCLHVEDLENRQRCNNIRRSGLPEAPDKEDLKETMKLIFNTLLDRPPTEAVTLDRVHRTLIS